MVAPARNSRWRIVPCDSIGSSTVESNAYPGDASPVLLAISGGIPCAGKGGTPNSSKPHIIPGTEYEFKEIFTEVNILSGNYRSSTGKYAHPWSHSTGRS